MGSTPTLRRESRIGEAHLLLFDLETRVEPQGQMVLVHLRKVGFGLTGRLPNLVQQVSSVLEHEFIPFICTQCYGCCCRRRCLPFVVRWTQLQVTSVAWLVRLWRQQNLICCRCWICIRRSCCFRRLLLSLLLVVQEHSGEGHNFGTVATRVKWHLDRIQCQTLLTLHEERDPQ